MTPRLAVNAKDRKKFLITNKGRKVKKELKQKVGNDITTTTSLSLLL